MQLAHSRNRLIASLAPDDARLLAPYLEEVDLPMRATLCAPGVRIRHVVFPHDAVTSMLVELPEGDSVEVALAGVDGMVGFDLLYGATESIATVIVQVPGRGLRMRADDFTREVVKPQGAFYEVLLSYMRVLYAMVAQIGACNASHSLEQRLARRLLMCDDRVQRHRFPMTHEFLAFMLGVRRATVTEAASALRVAGAIHYARGEVHIVDRKLLEQHACGCYEALLDLAGAQSPHIEKAS